MIGMIVEVTDEVIEMTTGGETIELAEDMMVRGDVRNATIETGAHMVEVENEISMAMGDVSMMIGGIHDETKGGAIVTARTSPRNPRLPRRKHQRLLRRLLLETSR